MQHTGRWLWELDNGQRICRCPDCGFGNLIGLYRYRNPYNYCASCGHLMIPQEQTRTVDETMLNRALCVIDWYLKDNPRKTIVIEEEDGDRICLIADMEQE
jgi:DNA-directed RNA polymerase subunit RPC12/RpoP